MPRRPATVAGWILCGLALASLQVFPGQTVRLYAIFIMLATCGGALLHSVYAIRSRGRTRRLWIISTAALACWAYAEVSVGVETVVTGVAPGRGLVANLFNLAALGLTVAAMFSVPSGVRDRAERARTLLDGVVTTAALGGIAWDLVLAPMTRLEGSRDAIFDLAYPVLAVGVVAVAFVVLAGQTGRRPGAVAAIAGGVLVVALTLFVEVFSEVAGVSWLRPWVLDGYVAAAGLVAVAPFGRLREPGEREDRPDGPVALALPYLPVAGYGVFCIAPALFGRPMEAPIIWAGATMIGGILARQFFTLRRNVALTRDLAQQRTRFAHEATHDALTGLPNRAGFAADLDAAHDGAVLLMIDLDGFKAVNDTLGHAAGDRLLVVVADRIRAAITPYGADATGARLGGDEFAVLLRGHDLTAATDLAAVLLAACAEPVPLDGRAASVRASIGIAGSIGSTGSAERLMHEADLALYEAKRRGKGRYRCYDAALSSATEAQRVLEAEIGGALAAGELTVRYQPYVDLVDATTSAFDAAPHWDHPRLGPLRWADFRPAAADAGLVPEIERRALAAALAQVARWREDDALLRVSVRLSARYLAAGTIVNDVRRELAANLLPAGVLDVRVTDTAAVDELVAELQRLREDGVTITLDGFGAGHSTLVALRTLPVDVVMLDPVMVRDADRSPGAAALLSAAVTLLTSIGLACAAGGVQTLGQAALLRELGCRRATGAAFGPAVAAEAVIPRPAFAHAAG